MRRMCLSNNLTHSILLLLASVLIASSVLAAPPIDESDSADPLASVEGPKLFNWQQFKQTFNKHYPNASEDLARSRILLANAMQVFMSWFNFQSKSSSSYQRLNEMCDWTGEEIHGLYSHDEEEMQESELPDLMVEPAELDRELAKIMADKDQGLAQILQDPSLDNLAALQGYDKYESVLLPVSNNPHYEEPVVFSYGDDVRVEHKVDNLKPSFLDVGSVFNNIQKTIDNVVSEHDKMAYQVRGHLATLNNFYTSIGGAVHGEIVGLVETAENKKQVENEVIVDHRKSGCLTSPRSQGTCGSCYIFSTIALMEYEYCMRTGNLTEFSEQYVLDCGKMSCKEGYGNLALDFCRKHGLELKQNYPYIGKEDSCPYDVEKEGEKMGYLRVDHMKYKGILRQSYPNDLIQRNLDRGPILFGINISEDFLRYGGGIHSPDEANSGGHLMLLIGHGRQDGIDYWIFKNSHGISWGEKGYYRIDKKKTNPRNANFWVIEKLFEGDPEKS